MAAPAKRRSSWRMGRIAGVEIRVHPTFLILVGLALLGGFGPPVSGVVTLGLLFGSVLVHELAHSLVARRKGIVVRDIVLLPIGGASEMEMKPERPVDELVIAIAGPLTSALLSACAFGLLMVTGKPVSPAFATGGLVVRLAWANAMLAGFNLLPAFPMDGGRVLRAALTLRLGLARATSIAARAGRLTAIAMAVTGVFIDLWLVFIAVFIYVAARAEEASLFLHLSLQGHHVRDRMRPPPADLSGATAPVGLVLSADDDLDEALTRALDAGTRAVWVADDGVIEGVLVVDDLLSQDAAVRR